MLASKRGERGRMHPGFASEERRKLQKLGPKHSERRKDDFGARIKAWRARKGRFSRSDQRVAISYHTTSLCKAVQIDGLQYARIMVDAPTMFLRIVHRLYFHRIAFALCIFSLGNHIVHALWTKLGVALFAHFNVQK